jgi:hypothetical protein
MGLGSIFSRAVSSTALRGQREGEGVAEMICYEFYVRDKVGGDKLIGILPERRNKPERTDLESIMRWPSAVFGKNVALDNVYFVIVSCWENGDGDAFKREEILVVNRDFLNPGDGKD